MCVLIYDKVKLVWIFIGLLHAWDRLDGSAPNVNMIFRQHTSNTTACATPCVTSIIANLVRQILC